MRQIILILFLILSFISCRNDDEIILQENIKLPPQKSEKIVGFYLLNEGNMNQNKASLDYYDYASGVYNRNIYGQANPESTLGLGDVGNDIQIYGSKIYIVVNASNKLEILDLKTNKRLKIITIKNPRYITFHKNKAFVSAYDGNIQMGNSPNGSVFEIDTLQLNIGQKIEVGRQPEQLKIINNKLYIANSGGYSPENYEKTISIFDINTYKKIKDLEIAINLRLLQVDSQGDLYISSQGDYLSIASKLFVIDTKNDIIKKQLDIPVSNFSISGNYAYIISSEYNYKIQKTEISYNILDIKTETILNQNFIKDGTEIQIKYPYGIAVDSFSGNFYITDAKSFVEPGKLIAYSKEGKQLFSVTTGDIPAHFAFVYR